MSKDAQRAALSLEVTAYLQGTGKYAKRGPGAITRALHAAFPEGVNKVRQAIKGAQVRFSLRDYWSATVVG